MSALGKLTIVMFAALAVSLGCGNSSSTDGGQGDAANSDSGLDGSIADAGKDASMDAALDGAADSGVDGGFDGSLDGSLDGAMGDTGSGDASIVMLDPTAIPKYKSPMVIPPVMPYESKTVSETKYRIAVRQFQEQILPPGYPKTTVWGYGRASDPVPGEGGPSTFNSPSFTVETRSNENVRVAWVNDLKDKNGNYLPHLFPVDRTLMWANPGNEMVTKENAGIPYTGPVPIVTHLHGSHVEGHSDGGPNAWMLPAAKNIPGGYFLTGPDFQTQDAPVSGEATYVYSNSQRATALWYHDHALGMTRLNVHTGLAGFWMIRDGIEDGLNLPGPAPKLGDPPGTRYYEIPIAIQDRSFKSDGSIFYPDSRSFFGDYSGPYIPDSMVPPIWNPEYFGNAMMVNGVTWPYLEVEPRLYRFRILNGCDARFVVLKFNWSGLKFHIIGNEGGFLSDNPVAEDELIMSPAERFDVLVDFSGFAEGQEVYMLNVGPEEPFGDHATWNMQPPSNPETTGQVMKFKIVAKTNNGTAGAIPASLPHISPLTSPVKTRDVTFHELATPGDVPFMARLGTPDQGPLAFADPPTETPKKGDTEIWRMINLTADGHPIHLHLVSFQVLDRRPFDVAAYQTAMDNWIAGTGPKMPIEDFYTGPAEPAYEWENGWKDTVMADTGMVTRIIANFDIAGLYVWHCHIIEHEDNEMMRPLLVLP